MKQHEEVSLEAIDYKNVTLLKQFVTKFNKITPRAYSGNTVKQQKKIARAIKQARYMALLPYVLDLKQKEEIV